MAPFVFVLLVVISIGNLSKGFIVDKNPYHHKEILDPSGKYVLEWLVDKDLKKITFNVTVKTTGYVGLGLSKDGRMEDADIVVGGVDHKGKTYFHDMHVVNERKLKVDHKQDWWLLECKERDGVTFLSFYRSFDTCDKEDYAITSDHVELIWAYGEKDDIGNHYHHRGSFSVYLLDPSHDPDIDALTKQRKQPTYSANSGPVQSWKLKRRHKLHHRRTSHWCSIHAGPKLPHKHHIIGYRTYLENEAARLHTQHLVVYRCKAPEGVDPKVLFEPFTKYSGEECHLNENRKLPLELCRDIVSTWGFGGKPSFLPETVGLPVGEKENEYLLFETHYDNLNLRSDLEFEVGVEYFISAKTRKREGSTLAIGYDISGSLALIPPGSPDFRLIGQCSPNCTKTMFPNEVDIIAVGLHSRSSGRKMQLRQFHHHQEKPWIMNDENYLPTFQQMRLLSEERRIHPGDHLITKCNYDNTLADGTTTVTGFGTLDERCLAYVIIASRIPYFRCTSEYESRKLLDLLGVDNVVWDIDRQQRVVTEPSSLQGLTLGQVSDHHVHWTELLREKLENDIIHSAHIGSCPSSAVPSAFEFIDAISPQLAKKVGAAAKHKEDLQHLIEQAVSKLLNHGIQELHRHVGWHTIIKPLTFLGTPILPQGIPATGYSGLGISPNVILPKGMTLYRPPSTCRRHSLVDYGGHHHHHHSNHNHNHNHHDPVLKKPDLGKLAAVEYYGL